MQFPGALADLRVRVEFLDQDLPGRGRLAQDRGQPGGTEQDMSAGGYAFTALKGTSFMDPQVVADTALYLNSDLAAKVTGVTIPVDAGHLILPGVNATPVK